jgi:hypothetical protein
MREKQSRDRPPNSPKRQPLPDNTDDEIAIAIVAAFVLER